MEKDIILKIIGATHELAKVTDYQMYSFYSGLITGYLSVLRDCTDIPSPVYSHFERGIIALLYEAGKGITK